MKLLWQFALFCIPKHSRSLQMRRLRTIGGVNVCQSSALHAVPLPFDNLDSCAQSLVTTLDLTAQVGGSIDMKYAFMFPTAIAVSTLAISAGIGGAALFAPILLILFPMLGPDYPLKSASASVATAILVETFGFTSGCIGYVRRNLVDFDIAWKFSIISVPVAILSAKYLALDPVALKVLYSALMLALSVYFLLGGTTEEEVSVAQDASDCTIEPVESCVSRFDTDDNEYRYDVRSVMTEFGGLATVLGGGLTGVLGVGVGEVVLPQLLRRGVPVPVAAASSTLCVTATALSSATIQISTLVGNPEGGIEAVPWNLIQFMIPGVLIGGQIASKLQGKVPKERLEVAVGTLFFVIGASFALITYFQTH